MEEREFRYQPFFCEENAWHLCDAAGLVDPYAIFISNPSRQVVLLQQRAAASTVDPVIWDYHVVVVARIAADREWSVWDLDSLLGLAIPASSYLNATFALSLYLPQYTAPRFRIVPGDVYRSELCSDRSHMRRSDGTWLHPPPAWPPPGEGTNLMRFVDMEEEFLGEVVDLDEMRRRFASRML